MILVFLRNKVLIFLNFPESEFHSLRFWIDGNTGAESLYSYLSEAIVRIRIILFWEKILIYCTV